MIFLLASLFDPTCTVLAFDNPHRPHKCQGTLFEHGGSVYCLTAYHCIEGTHTVDVVHNSLRYRARPIFVDKDRDICVLSASFSPGLPAFQLQRGPSDLTHHHALLTSHDETIHAVIPSEISSKRTLFFDVSLRSGESGGFVLSESGELVGCISGGWMWKGEKTWPARCGTLYSSDLIGVVPEPPIPDGPAKRLYSQRVGDMLNRLFRGKPIVREHRRSRKRETN